jgi:hypothetical protein
MSFEVGEPCGHRAPAAKAVLAGVGPRRVLRPAIQGTVLASFSRACYLDLPDGLVVLVGPDAHPGPLHFVLDRPVPRLAPGAVVAVGAGELLVGQWLVDLSGLRPWWGHLPAPELVQAAAPLLCGALEDVAGRSPLPATGARASDGLARLAAGDLEGAAKLLAGFGPGLTPAGDDVLAGAMFGLRAAGGPGVEPALARIAAALPAGRISRAFLEWAPRGQALAPVHDLLAAGVRADRAGLVAHARALAAVGASSGADFALGLQSVLLPQGSRAGLAGHHRT